MPKQNSSEHTKVPAANVLEPRYVDTREAPERRLPLEAAGFAPKALSAGDIQFPEAGGGTVLIEHKRLYQFVADMESGQLQRQMQHVIAESDFPWLMVQVDGAVAIDGYLSEHRVTSEQIRNQLATLQDLGCRWERVESAEEAVSRTLQLERYYSKGLHISAQRHLSGDSRIDVLARIEGVGEQKALKLVSYFGNLMAVAQARRDELEQLDGIGPKLAERIFAFWR